MRLKAWMCAGLSLFLAGPTLGWAQSGMAAPKSAAAKVSPSESLNSLMDIMESQIVPAAEAMPADKYDFAPSTSIGLYAGVRTFGQQVKHLAEANYLIFKAYGVPGAVDSKTIEALTTKEQIVDALKTSCEYAHAAINTITPENAFDALGAPQRHFTYATLAAYGIAHSMDHYGQMVEYLRMNGIVPPASQPRPKK